MRWERRQPTKSVSSHQLLPWATESLWGTLGISVTLPPEEGREVLNISSRLSLVKGCCGVAVSVNSLTFPAK